MASRQRTGARQRGRSAPRRSQRGLFILGFVGFLLLVIIGSVALLGRNATDQQAAALSSDVAVSEAPVPASAEVNGRAWGPPDAPITVIEYADYECEACGAFARQYEAEFVEAFANTGKVRFEIRNAPFHGEGARNAAEAAYCSIEQNAFWPMHDSLFLNQPVVEGTGTQAFSDTRLNAIAAKLGLDTAAFGQCLGSNKYAAQVEADYNETVAQNIRQTPTFVINGTAIPGVLSVEDFRQIFAEVAPDVSFTP
jgi:protein-disulfide isomerase